MRDADLTPLLRPASIAVVGASNDAAKVGGMPLRLLREQGYTGRVYAVNARGGDVQGMRALPSLDALPEPVDLAIVAVPAAAAPHVVAQMVRTRTRAAVLFTAGFAETGEAGGAAQREIARMASAAGMALLGPNCLGLMNLRERVYATFSPVALAGAPPLGDVALVSQSGAFGAYAFALAREAQLGLSHWITTGNEAGVQVADAVEWLAHDPLTSVILVYLEGCADGAKLRRALAAARAAGKPVVVAKVGTTATGARAAQSHTASLAGEDAVYQAVFDEYGVHRADTLEGFFRLGNTLSKGRRPRSRQTAIVTVSGGVGIMMADRAEALGLALPPLPEACAARLRESVAFASTANPIDVTGQVVAQTGVLTDTLVDAMTCGAYGSVVAFVAGAAHVPSAWAAIEQAVERAMAHRKHGEHGAPSEAAQLVLCGLVDDTQRSWLEARGVLALREPVYAMDAVAALLRAGEQADVARGEAADARGLDEATEPASSMLPSSVPAHAASLDEAEAMAMLAAAGVPVAPHCVAGSVAEAQAAAQRLGCPVALKLRSRHVLHKSDMGGVRLNLRDTAALARAFDAIATSAAQAGIPGGFEGVVVARMLDGWGEIIVGVRRDPVFGPVAMTGLGGTGVELGRKMAFGLAPLSHERALAMLETSGVAALLRGHRGHPALSLDAAAAVLAAVSRLGAALGETLDTLEINPFIVTRDGLVAADAVVTLHPQGDSRNEA
ncbi:acetate--CoA ligase family protein [Paraburkholderia pallida]|uniref:CoA-binding protein n=1 Tax=Paraburkholderia pallida TaxID=2547399 RepID=A0A4P7CTJ1_9BURK|nr:acetate--CoA ligase family protein [Paraburkholderia pallida]QBQ99315.1 CoA-binding protein [Paraburkholderia pallida]